MMMSEFRVVIEDLRRDTLDVELDLLTAEIESSKETGCRAPEDPFLCIKYSGFFDCTATMNMCSQCQKDIILLKQEHAKLATISSKDVERRSSSSDESKLALAGAAVVSAGLASKISQLKSKEGLKKCTSCHKHAGLTGFSCKCCDLFCTVHHYSDKHNCLFDYMNAGQNGIAKISNLKRREVHLGLVLKVDSQIADENSGGFPNAKNNGMTDTRCEGKREMKAPSLVARIMGLESMPAGSSSKPQKASASETWSNVADKLGA
ncbi:hypothetical protein CQW23_30247 [Capsicum baccatum]|uniref:AN1-type domain-containing protein n=1 Tax=Capsicum baccatum TaxID=33114 RepID=A0A2G2VB34_CAPBA|nr:hypothetical protein CQW23_30247 [Capsicum baccatum]